MNTSVECDIFPFTATTLFLGRQKCIWPVIAERWYVVGNELTGVLHVFIVPVVMAMDRVIRNRQTPSTVEMAHYCVVNYNRTSLVTVLITVNSSLFSQTVTAV